LGIAGSDSNGRAFVSSHGADDGKDNDAEKADEYGSANSKGNNTSRGGTFFTFFHGINL